MSFIQIKQTNKKFIDLDLTFNRHPISGDVSRRVNENAIITSVKNLIMTRTYDRLFHPEISSHIGSLLFEQMTPATIDTLKKAILYVIENFEPRVIMQLVEVNPYTDANRIEITLVFKIVGSEDTITTNFFLKRSL